MPLVAGDLFGLGDVYLNTVNPSPSVSSVEINSTASGAGITVTSAVLDTTVGIATLTLSTSAGLTTTPFYTGAKIAVSGLSTAGVAYTGYNGVFVVTGFAGTTTVSYTTTGYVGTVSPSISTTGQVTLVTDTAIQFSAWSGNNTHGWFGGGWAPGAVSTVDRVDFSNDSVTASPRGPLFIARNGISAVGNSNYGWFGGGFIPTPAIVSSRVDRIDFSNDSGTASVRGPLSVARTNPAATGNSNYGWFGGGVTPVATLSTVDRIDFSNDSGTASLRGPLSLERTQFATTGNSNYGWFGGGSASGLGLVSRVDRIDFSNDSATASVRGPLSSERYNFAATGNSNYGWFGGGYVSGPVLVSRVDRIDFSNDSATASPRGPLSLERTFSAATGNSNYGWFGGGGSPTPAVFSTVDRIDFSNDSATASLRSPLSLARQNSAATSGQAKGPANKIPTSGTYGWFGGGFVNISYVDRIDFTNDTNVSPRGNLPSGRGFVAATGNKNYGWFAGGYPSLSFITRIDYSNDSIKASDRSPFAAYPIGIGIYASSGAGNQNYGWFDSGATNFNSFQRINYSNDLRTPSTRGTIPSADDRGAVSNSNYGWWGCGFLNGSLYARLDFSNDLAAATIPRAATLTQPGSASYRYRTGTSSNKDYGWFVGGKISVPSFTNLSTVERLNFSNDTANSVIRAYATARGELAGTGNSNYGWYSGGETPGGAQTSLVERISYANDSGTASTRTPLVSGVRRNHAGVSNTVKG